MPVSRTRGSGGEKYFRTLHPHTPTVVSSGCARGGTMPPQRRAIVERGWERDECGNERSIRRGSQGCGVDGLKGGHWYKVGVAGGEWMGIWWRWGVKGLIRSLRWNLSELELEQM